MRAGASECSLAHMAIGLPKAPDEEPAAITIPLGYSGVAVVMAGHISAGFDEYDNFIVA